MHIRPVRERDLGRIQMVGSLTIIFLILVIIGNFLVYAQYEAHAKELRTQKEQLVERAIAGLEQEGEHLYRYIDYYRHLTGKRLRESVKERVGQAFAIAQKIARNRHDSISRARVKETLSQLRWRNGYSYIWIVDKEGKAVLFDNNPLIEGSNILDVVDARGKRMVQDILDIAAKNGEGYVEDIAMRIDTGKNVEQIAFVKYLPSLEWVIGTGETIDDIEMATQTELLERIEQMRPTGGTIGVMDAENRLLVGKEAPQSTHIDQARSKTFRYQNGHGEELLFARKIPKWGWTIFITLPLAGIETHIAELATLVDTDFNQGLIVLGTLFLGVSMLSVYLSYLLSRRLRLAFRHHRLRSLNQRKSMRGLYRSLSHEQQRSNEALEAKNRFLSNLSHELHTPLTALMGYATLLTQHLPAPYKKNAQIIAEASEQLLVLQNDLIACANAENIPIVQNYFDVAKMARHFYRIFEQKAQKRSCKWSLLGADAPIMLTNDQAKVYRMLLALLENVFHSSSRSSVELHLRRKKGKIRVFIRDSSPLADAHPINTDAFKKAHQLLGAGSLQSSWAVVHSHARILNLPLRQRLHDKLGRCYWFSLEYDQPPQKDFSYEMIRLEKNEHKKLLNALNNGHMASIRDITGSVHDDATREKLRIYLNKGDINALEKAITLCDSRHPEHF